MIEYTGRTMPRLGPYLTGNYATTQTPFLNPSSWVNIEKKHSTKVKKLILLGFSAALQKPASFHYKILFRTTSTEKSSDPITQWTIGVWFRWWWQIAVLHTEFEFSIIFGPWLWLQRALSNRLQNTFHLLPIDDASSYQTKCLLSLARP